MPGAEFNSPVEEAVDEAASLRRTTIGNTFACAAVRRDRFFELGALDEIGFPNGYNDVDFCLRAGASGMSHINLGDFRMLHQIGASRARTDEIAQKLALRSAYPGMAHHALREIESEPLSMAPVVLGAHLPGVIE